MIIRTSSHFISKMQVICAAVLMLPVLNAFADETLIFTAPPRESFAEGQKTYGPIVKYLSKVIGKKIIYQHQENWSTYAANMRKGKYDMVFDSSHFVSWRIININHTPVIKTPGEFSFKLVANRDNADIQNINDLVGKRVCGHSPPNQGTLRLYNQFSNPTRLPILIAKKGWRNIYNAMIEGKCDAAILPKNIYKIVDPKKNDSKVLFTSVPTSGQAITVSQRFNSQEIVKIRKALLSKPGQQATMNLRERFASPTLAAANASEYYGISRLLSNSYGFSNQ